MKEWNHFLKDPSASFDCWNYGFKMGLIYNEIITNENYSLEKVVTTLPYRNFLFLSLIYISILILIGIGIGITYGSMEEGIMLMGISDALVIPTKKFLKKVSEIQGFRPLIETFSQNSIHFSPSRIGNLALDIPRKLTYIVTKAPLYRSSDGSNINSQLSHPITVGFSSDGSIFSQAHGTIKFNFSSLMYPLEAFSYNKNSQTFYGISPYAIIYNPQHPEYAYPE
jgi:hypothetical protein